MVDSTATAAVEHLGADGRAVPDAYYVRLDGGRFHSTLHSQGAWNDHEQHMAPASGLMVHELLRNHPRAEMVMSRINFEILGIIHGGEFEIETRVLRPGRTIELLEATFTAQGRTAIRAQAWRLLPGDTADVAGPAHPGLPRPDGCPPAPMQTSGTAASSAPPSSVPSPTAGPATARYGRVRCTRWCWTRTSTRWPVSSALWTPRTAWPCGRTRASTCSPTWT